MQNKKWKNDFMQWEQVLSSISITIKGSYSGFSSLTLRVVVIFHVPEVEVSICYLHVKWLYSYIQFTNALHEVKCFELYILQLHKTKYNLYTGIFHNIFTWNKLFALTIIQAEVLDHSLLFIYIWRVGNSILHMVSKETNLQRRTYVYNRSRSITLNTK